MPSENDRRILHTRTVQRDPTRLSRWVRIALEEVEKYLG